ncbi:MAG: hypothetical protein HQL14_00160 [Candidatus Omnitrophica bacterium]|nr:hypothetical protein [Candidatus Omnitrophota bacterium]
MGLFALLISSLTGYFVLSFFKNASEAIDIMDIFSMTGLGLGISAQIVFYTLLILGRIDPMAIIQGHLLCLCALFILSRYHVSRCRPVFSFTVSQGVSIFLILCLVLGTASLMAVIRPWGDWDGWAYWNYHANFLFKSGSQWQRLFEFNIQAHHPWMLPLMIIWGWSFNPVPQALVPAVIGIIFTIGTVGLLIGALKRHVSFFSSVLGGIFLASIPIYIYHGTSQYADILAAYFILLSSVLAADLLKAPAVNTAVLAGLCLGLTACVKDNSLLASVLLFILVVIRLYKTGASIFIRPLSWGFTVFLVSAVLMKIFEISFLRYNTYDVFLPGLWIWPKWVLIGQFAWASLSDLNWGGLWLLAMAVLILRQWSVKEPQCLLARFIAFFIIFNFFVFAASGLKLEWLLSVSFNRLLYLLAPTVIFLVFCAIGQRE